MKITCAISPEQLEKLYKHVTLNMQEARAKNKNFDPNAYMESLFKKIESKSGTDNAVKFLQPVPLMIFKAYTTIPNYVNDVVFDVDPVLRLNRLFTDELTGMRNVLKTFVPEQNQSVLKEAIFQTELLEAQTPLTEIEAIEPFRFEPMNVFSGTLQQFIPVDLQQLDKNLIQRSSEERAVFYKVFDRLNAEGKTEGLTGALTYQGRNLKLKPVRLTEINQDDLDGITKKYLVKALSIQKQGTAKEGVIKPDQIIMTVLADENGNFVRFDSEANISDQGSIVYQSMRNVVIKNKRFVPVDNYGKPTFLSAISRIEKSYEVSNKVAKEIFQGQLKALYNLRNNILKGEVDSLTISGFSTGVAKEFTQKSLQINHLPLFGLTDAVRTIRMEKEAGSFKATITLEDQEFNINRPYLDNATAEKISEVLTNDNISYKEKKDYIQQFLPSKIDSKYTRLNIKFLDTNKTIIVAYSDKTYQDDPFRKFNNLDLTEEESKAKILDGLLNATSSKLGNTFPIRTIYNEDLLNSDSYLDYNIETSKFSKAEDSYSTYLSGLKGGAIDLSSANAEEVFNQYINYAIPSKLITQLNKAQEEEASEVRKRKDAIVDYVKQTDTPVAVVIEKVRSGTFENKPYVNAFFKSPVDNSETKIRVTGEVKEGDTVQLVIEDITKKDMYIPDVLSAVLDGKKVGNIEETDFGKGEAPRDEYYRQLFKNRQEKSTDEQIDDATTDDNTNQPSKGGLSSRFGFDRSGKLPADPGTKEQNKKAMEWWTQSDLSKYLDLETGVNIVNSDAFGRWISYGAVIAGKYGKVIISDKGTEVDIYHEAWHGFTQLFLTPKERKRLYQEVKRSLKGTKGLSYFEIEEYLAEEFRKYAKNPKAKKNSPARNSIFRKILNFLKKLLGVGYTTNPLEIKKVQEMFEALYYNKGLNKYTPSIDNVQFDLLERNIGITLPGTDTQVLSRQESLLVKDSMDSIISDIVDEVTEEIKQADPNNNKGVALKMVLDPNKKSVLYDVIKERLQEKSDSFKEERDKLDDSLDNQFKIDQLNEKIRVLDKAIGSYGGPSAGAVKFHLDNTTYKLLIDTYVEDELTADENKTTEDSERYADKKVGDKSLLEFAGKETIYMLKSLHEVQNGKTVENELGFKKLADFRLTWNNIVRSIAGESDPQVMYDKLVEASNQYEPFKQLVKFKLPNPSFATSIFDFKANTSFWQDFNKTRVPYIQLTLFQDGTAKVTNASLDTKNILRNFNNKYKADQNNPYVILDPSTGVTRLNLDKVVSEFGSNGFLTKSKALDFARAIGIYLDDIKTIRDELATTEAQSKYGLSFMYRTLHDIKNNASKNTLSTKDAKELQDFLEDPVSGLYKGISKDITGTRPSKQFTQLNRLAELQGRFGEAANIFGVLNAEGNVVYEYIENNTVSTRTRSINAADNFTELIDSDMNPMSYLSPDKNTFTSKSVLLRSLFNLDTYATRGNKIQGTTLELFIDSGTTRELGEGTNTSNLDEKGKFLQDFHMMLIDGTQEFIRAASKKSAFGLRFRGSIRDKSGKPINDKRSNLYISLDRFKEDYIDTVNMINDEFMIGYLASEGNRIHKFVNNKEEFKKYTGFNRKLSDGRLAGESFTIFDDMLTPELKNNLYEIIENNKDEVFDLEEYLIKNPSLAQRVKMEINQYFTYRIEEVYARIESSDVLISDNVMDQVKDIENVNDRKMFLAATYYYNAWIHNFETANLIEGDLSQYNHEKEELSKRSPGTKSGGKTFRVDSAAQNFINSESFKAGSYSRLGNINTDFRYDGTLVTAVMKDIERDSVYIPEIKKGLEEYYSKNIKDKDRVKKLVENDLSNYRAMEEADGQGYITFDAYRALKNLENDWSYEQEQLFNKVARGENISAREITELFPPYKLFYSGSIKEAKLPVNSMHKFSLMPLIPSLVKGSDLESLHNQMIKQGVAYSLFSTGSKTSHIAENGSADIIYNDDVQKDLKTDIQFTPNTIYVDYLKNVTSVPKKFKNKTIFSTQFRKLILKDLYNRGVITDPKAKDFAEKYNTLVESYMQVLEQQLLDEIGYKKVDGKYIGNIKNFLDLVQRELGRRNVPEHQIAFVGENVNETLKTDLSFHFKAADIEKMMVGVIEKRLIKQRVKGEALVQVSSAMTNGMWGTSTKFEKASSEQLKQYAEGTNNLAFYTKNADGSTAAMKVAIAMQGDFTNLYNVKDKDGKSIKVFDKTESVDDAGNPVTTSVFNEKATLANLNRLIKDEDWLDANGGRNRKLITMTAVRIPVQGLNSMEFMEVFEFLPAEAGNILIPPTEIVAKSGSDFDIDKLNVFMPNIDAKGRLIEQGESLSSKKKGLENEIISTITDILSLESNYANLVRPNSTFLVKEEIADQIADKVSDYNRYDNVHQNVKLNSKGNKIISPTRTIEPIYNVQKHVENMIGKKVLGIVAIENALSVVINASKNGKMPKTYKQEGRYNKATQTYELTNIDRDMRLFLPHNKFPDDSISISDVYAQDGNNIGEIFSQILNGFVDIEKDPWVFNIQGNYEVMPVLLYLIKTGVPVKTAVAFVSNPFVREYAKKQREIKSSYATEYTKPTFVKYQAAGRTIEQLALPENKKGSTYSFMERDPETGEETGKEITVYNYITNEKYYDVISNKMGTKTEFTNADIRSALDNGLYFGDANKVALDMFLHFLEIEKQMKGLSSLKRQSNPDTRRSKSVQELLIREANYDNLSDLTKVDQELVNELRNESILSNFRIADLISDLVNPVFGFRNDPAITDFLKEKLKTFGGTVDEKALMITRFKDGIMDYIYQNYQNSFVDSQGNITTDPDSYLGLSVKDKKGILKGVEVNQEKGIVYIDNAQIQKDFDSKIYTSEQIKQRGLRRVSKDVFRNVTEYKKFVVAREYLRSLLSKEDLSKNKDYASFKQYFKNTLNMSEKEASEQAFEAFLNREALFDSFNRATIMGTGEFSYADTMMSLIKNNPQLRTKYPILGQFYIPTQGKFDKGVKVLSLKNIREVSRESELGDTYYNNLKDLADPTVKKVADPSENLRISRMFAKLPLISLYQHGFGGYNTQSIIDILPYTNFLDIMSVASDKFITKQLNKDVLDYVFKKVRTSRGRFTDFTVEPKSIEKPDINLIPETEDGSVDSKRKEISEIFKSVPELASIGTQEQYSQYLDSVFPNSKVKDILYHGTTAYKIGDTISDFQDRAFYIGTKETALGYAYEIKSVDGKSVRFNGVALPVKINATVIAYGAELIGESPETLSQRERQLKNAKLAKQGKGVFTINRGDFDANNLALSENSGDIAYYSTEEEFENRLNKRQKRIKGEELDEFIEFLEERVIEVKAGRAIDTIETNADADPTVFYAALDPNKVLFLGSAKDMQGFKNFISGKEDQDFNEVKGKKIINNEDIESFKKYKEKSNGVNPKEFFTSKSKFTEFYNNDTGKREGAPQSSIWMLQPNGRYDLTDKATGEVYITNVDLNTGIQYLSSPSVGKSKTYDGLVDIKNLKDNQDTVFGSNQFGFHGGGTAGILYANDPRAYKKQDIEGKGLRVEVGKARGFQTGTEGSSYAIQTVTDWKLPMDDPKRQVLKDEIIAQIKEMYDYYRNNPTREAFVLYTTQGKNLNGYTPQEMADMFSAASPENNLPKNIIFNKEFRDLMYTEPEGTKETFAPNGKPPINRTGNIC